MRTETTNCTVLITGVGAIIGQGIIKSLQLAVRGFRLVGLDRDADALGKHLCDAFFVKPATPENDPAYVEFLLELIEREAIDVVMPGIEQDVLFFDAHRERFQDCRAAVVLNSAEVIALGRDKWLLHQTLLGAGLPTIATCLAESWPACLQHLGAPPFWAKPRQGSGGRGQGRIEDEEDFLYFRRKQAANLMLQCLVGTADEEYTVGVFGFGDGRSTPPAILRRHLGPGGATWTAESVLSDPTIESFCAALTRALKPLGPTNFQFRKEAGQALLLEINPRFSASVSLRAALGFNEAWMSVEFFHFLREPSFEHMLPGRCFRYIEDHIEYL